MIELSEALVTAWTPDPSGGPDTVTRLLGPVTLRLTERRVAVVGANGSGKSTLARLLNGLVLPSSGTVRVDGLDTRTDGPAVRRRVGFVFTDPDAQLVMPTPVEDVALSLRRSVPDAREREARAREAARTPAPPPAGRDPGGSDDDRCRTTYDGPPFYTSPPTKGGDGSNGRLPGSMLAATSWGVDPKGTRYYLRTEATAALERLNVAFRAEFGHDLDLDLTYRDYATQVAMREALGSIAARPGTSKHGTGYALDVPELPCEYGYGTPQHTWLVGTGPSFGWVQPSWARQGGSNPEYWHFEYVG